MAYVFYIAELEKDLPFFWEERQRLYGACYGAGALLMLMVSAIWLTWVTTKESRVQEAYGSFPFAVVRFHTSALPA